MTLRVVYDTNVLVSATLTPEGTPASLVSLALARRVQLCVSPCVSRWLRVMAQKHPTLAAGWRGVF